MMFEFINVLKTMAALLITNSHFDNLYPKSLFSIGGGLGNVLFFLVSGFCLSSSVNKRFDKWMFHCFRRVYPPLWIISLILVITNNIILTEDNILRTFLFPYRSFWFISAILVAYMLAWFVARFFSGKLYIPLLITISIYFVFYIFYLDLSKWSVEGADFFKYIFYFGVMLCGMGMRKKLEWVNNYTSNNSKMLFFATLITIFGYLIGKILMIKVSWFSYIQFLVQLFTLAFGVACFLWMLSLEPLLNKHKSNALVALFRTIGSSTLEIYLINYAIVKYAEHFQFPISVLLALVLIMSLGSVLHVIISHMMKIVNKENR